MAGRMKKVVDYVKTKVYFKNLAVARFNMMLGAGANVEDFTEDTPDDPELERKLIEAAKKILNVDRLDIP
jgi:hypothetical protein